MRATFPSLALALLGAVYFACSSSSSSSTPPPPPPFDAGNCKGTQAPLASCTSANPNDGGPGSECIEFNGAKTDFGASTPDGGGQMVACKYAGGMFVSGSGCPTANLLGRCIIDCGTDLETTFYFYPGATYTSKAQAQEVCTSRQGVFLP